MQLWRAYLYKILHSPLLMLSIILTALTGCVRLFTAPQTIGDGMNGLMLLINVDAYRKLLPLISAIPFAATFCTEWNSHMLDSIVCRSRFNRYVITQVLFSVLTNIVVSISGLLLFLAILETRYPFYGVVYIPNAPYVAVSASGFPWQQLAAIITIHSISCAMWGLCGLVISTIFPNIYVAYCSPLICCYLIEHLTNRFPTYLRFYSMALGIQVLPSKSALYNFGYTIIFYLFWITMLALLFRYLVLKRVRNEIH